MTLDSFRPPRAVPRRQTRLFAATVLAVLAILAPPLAAQERLTFIGVALDQPTRDADRKLQDYLYRTAGVGFAPEDLEYARVIDRLRNWRPEEGPFLARTTPFVYVAAEMLGAELELLATYVSEATGRRVYHSYLVVRRDDFPEPPSAGEVVRLLAGGPRGERLRFVYHSEFSTSSFFLPSLYLKAHGVYHMEESTGSLVAVDSRRIDGGSSSRLVELVAGGDADLAAVWDGTREKFMDPESEIGRRVHFVRLPTPLPNDLLVCSASLDEAVKARLRDAVGIMGEREIGVGDFRTWHSIREAADARAALAELRWLARQRPAPITVEVRAERSAPPPLVSTPAPQGALPAEAARQAVRLSGSELVVYDEDFHEHIDFVWTLEPIHDGAVVLRSAIPGSEVADQVFRISFADAEDLVRRLVDVVRSRLHRIRYAWPYSANPLIVIRDLADPVADGDTVKVQRIRWIDPERNHFRAGPLFDATVRNPGFYRYELEPDEPAAAGETAADALSNVSYRVLLLRASRERPLFRGLTVAFVVLLALAAAAAVYGLRRPADLATTADLSAGPETHSEPPMSAPQ